MADTSLWVNEGGVLHSPKLSDHLRYSAQPSYRFREFADVKEAFGKGKGDSCNFDKVADVASLGRRLVETQTMPLTSQTPTKGTLTIDEYGQGIPYTGKIEALSQFAVQDMINKGLKNSMVRTLDAGAGTQFNLTPLRYVGTATAGGVLTTNGTATATNTSVLNEYHIREMAFQLEDRNVPMLAGDTYALIANVKTVSGLKGAMVSIQQYSEIGYQKIASNEVGMVHGVRIIKDNNFTKYDIDLADGSATARAWTGANSLDAYMFGADTVMEGVAIPEEVRQKEVTDFGRSKGIAWYALLGWKLIWEDAPNARIIKWDSAA